MRFQNGVESNGLVLEVALGAHLAGVLRRCGGELGRHHERSEPVLAADNVDLANEAGLERGLPAPEARLVGATASAAQECDDGVPHTRKIGSRSRGPQSPKAVISASPTCA